MKKIIAILFIPLFLFASDIVIKYENLKPFYYKNQIVNLKIKILSAKPNLLFSNSPNIDLNITQINPYIYKLNARFKADKQNKIIEIYNNEQNETINLNKIIKIKNLPKIDHFSGVLANNLKIINPISSKYETNKTILSFTIKCKNCNLRDFNLSKKENLKVLSNNEATFYIILPKNKKELTFYYYNLLQNKFDKIEIPIILKENTISTQTNINPNENKFFTPLNLLLLILTAIGLVVFLIYQRVWLLIFPLLFIVLILIQFLPKGEVVLKKGTKLQILPTQNSTVFYIVKKKKKVKILNKRGNYLKVKINNKIGWVYENN